MVAVAMTSSGGSPTPGDSSPPGTSATTSSASSSDPLRNVEFHDIADLVATSGAGSRSSGSTTTSRSTQHVLWLHGKGKTLDPWLQVAEKVCAHYDVIVIEDELLIVAFREKTSTKTGSSTSGGSSPHTTTSMMQNLKCKLVPFDANEVADLERFHSLPWRPDEILPIQLEGIPLVSFHAHKVFSKEAQRNHHKWLQDPDAWTPYFLDMVRQGWVVMCLDADQCQNDRMPFRLIFTEEIGEEFIECLSGGIIPIYFLSANLASYLERVLLFMPFYFTSPEEMHQLVSTLTDGSGILQHGVFFYTLSLHDNGLTATGKVRMYMTHESNHYLTALYWGQSRFLRFLGAVTSMHYQELSLQRGQILEEAAAPGTTSVFSPHLVAGELLICVHSARQNRRARDLIRRTWARGSRYGAQIQIRVVFFVGHAAELEAEAEEFQDLVLLHTSYDDKFENIWVMTGPAAGPTIWVKTAAIMKFGMLQFRTPSAHTRVRYLIKADDDTFFNIDGMVEDLFAVFTGRKETLEPGKTNVTEGLPGGVPASSPREAKPTIEIQTIDIGNYESSKHLHTGHYWGFIMALVQPNRNGTDKYYVPYRSFGNEFYPAYARGLGYALSEDLVLAVGQEDVSVGLYLFQLAKMGRVKVRPMQRKDHMPLQIDLYCNEIYSEEGGPARARNWDLLEIHRYGYENHDCLWGVVEQRRKRGFQQFEPKKKYVPLDLDFCQCFKHLMHGDGKGGAAPPTWEEAQGRPLAATVPGYV
eukprot:g1995.t1